MNIFSYDIKGSLDYK